jgi:hypothetical protein
LDASFLQIQCRCLYPLRWRTSDLNRLLVRWLLEVKEELAISRNLLFVLFIVGAVSFDRFNPVQTSCFCGVAFTG